MTKIYERVFQQKFGPTFVSILLSNKYQNDIDKVVNEINGGMSRDEYQLQLKNVKDDVKDFLDSEGILYEEKGGHSENILSFYIDGYADPNYDDNINKIRDIQTQGKTAKQINKFLKEAGLEDYYEAENGEIYAYFKDIQNGLTEEQIDNLNQFIKSSDIIDKFDVQVTNSQIVFTRKDYNDNIFNELSNYPEVKKVLDDVKEMALIVINTIIESDFSEFFYPVKTASIIRQIADGGKYSINFAPKSKVAGANKHLNELSDILERKF